MITFTRGGSTANGKQRVLFVSHPQDAGAYMRPYAQMILAERNCAVYAFEDAAVQPPDWRETVSQMQLVMIPVTKAFLRGECLANEVLHFAAKRHIPLLLIQETALVSQADWDRFNLVCERLQALLPDGESGAGQPFAERLREFLQGALLEDALTEQVKEQAFDGHVFVSYRKKDAARARKLMKTVHDLPGCEALSLWYDEFLVLGEDFETSIQTNLEQSELVMMVVTPHVTEPGNYVIKEYAMARTAHKDVLPVEMVPTAPEALAPLFPGIEPVPKNRMDSIEDRLQMLRKGKETPSGEQKYLLGMAYLKGIHVEKDVERGAALLEKSLLEDGYRPAGQQLLSMYENGVDVERDLRKANEISYQIAATYGPRPEGRLDSAGYHEYLEDLFRNAELQLLEGKNDLAADRLAFVYSEAEQLKRFEGIDTDKLAYRALTLHRQACLAFGMKKEADRFAAQERALAARLFDDPARAILLESESLLEKAERCLYEAKAPEGMAICETLNGTVIAQLAREDLSEQDRKAMTLLRIRMLIVYQELSFYRYGWISGGEEDFDALEEYVGQAAREWREETALPKLKRRLYRIWAKDLRAQGKARSAVEIGRLARDWAQAYAEKAPGIEARLMLLDSSVDLLRAQLETQKGIPGEVMNGIAALEPLIQELEQRAYNQAAYQSAMARYHLLMEELMLKTAADDAAVDHAGKAVRFAEAADDLRNHPEELLTSLFALEGVSHLIPVYREDLLGKAEALCRDFPENESYRQIRAGIERAGAARGVSDAEEAGAFYELANRIARHPDAKERIVHWDRLLRDLSSRVREETGEADALRTLSEQVKEAFRSDQAALRERAKRLGFGDYGSQAERRRAFEEALGIYDTLLQVFPKDPDLMRERRWVVDLYNTILQ